MELKRLLSLTRQAIDKYEMISDGDVIAVGVSGGKDSLTVLYALSELKRFYPKKFEVCAITVDTAASEGDDYSKITDFCKELSVEHIIVDTEIRQIVFKERKEQNPCALCAKMRKGALNDELIKRGINKVAYGHHKDDFVNTMMLSLMYEGRLQTLDPCFTLDGTGISVIRPLMYVTEADVIGFKNKYNLPVVKSSCPADGFTKRKYVEELMRQINRDNPGVLGKMFNAAENQVIKEIRKE